MVIELLKLTLSDQYVCLTNPPLPEMTEVARLADFQSGEISCMYIPTTIL
jgi:hypothetical protein